MSEPTHPDADRAAPEAPASIPEYVREGVERQDASTLRELAAWAEALAEHREQRPIEVDEDEELVEVEDGDNDPGTTVVKRVPCGKDCDGCPHGPYEYRVHRDGQKLNWDYVGPVGEA